MGKQLSAKLVLINRVVRDLMLQDGVFKTPDWDGIKYLFLTFYRDCSVQFAASNIFSRLYAESV